MTQLADKPVSQLTQLRRRIAALLEQGFNSEFRTYGLKRDLDQSLEKPQTRISISKPDTPIWQVSIHNDPAELEKFWRQLEEQGASCTVFQTYDWASCWYETAASYNQA